MQRLCFAVQDKIYISIHHVCGHASNARNECADIAASFAPADSSLSAMHPPFWPTRQFCVQRFFNDSCCLTHIAELLPDARSRLLLGMFGVPSRCFVGCSCFTYVILRTVLQIISPWLGYLTLAQCCFDRCICKLLLAISQSRSQAMADNNVWVSAWFPHSFRPNELVQAYRKEERQGATGSLRRG